MQRLKRVAGSGRVASVVDQQGRAARRAQQGGDLFGKADLRGGDFDDLAFRDAVAKAIDKDSIVKDAEQGYVTAASQTSLVLPNAKDWLPSSIPDDGYISFDASAAKAELDRAFEDFYRSHLRDVYSYAYYRVGNHHDAEDLTEQAFLQAYRHFDRARRESDGRPLRPWVIRIAHNLASNYYRDRSRRPQTALENADPIAARHDTEAIAEGREELRQVMANLEHLSEDRREALIMRFALGMDNREIARALGRSDGATKVLIHRAIKQLQEEMSDERGE